MGLKLGVGQRGSRQRGVRRRGEDGGNGRERILRLLKMEIGCASSDVRRRRGVAG
jgi:hypothetical protein